MLFHMKKPTFELLRTWALQEAHANRAAKQTAQIAQMLESICRLQFIPHTAGRYYELQEMQQHAAQMKTIQFPGHKATAAARQRHWEEIENFLKEAQKIQQPVIL